jgi:hypothetical protein
LRDTSKAEEVFRAIDSLRAELTRLRQVERDYLKLREELKSLLARVEQERLATAPRGGVFYFSLDVGRYTSYSASNLEEFFRVLRTVPVESLEFHLDRGDFEAWLKSMGSEELASTFGALRKENLSGEALRKRLLEVIQPAGSDHEGTIGLF